MQYVVAAAAVGVVCTGVCLLALIPSSIVSGIGPASSAHKGGITALQQRALANSMHDVSGGKGSVGKQRRGLTSMLLWGVPNSFGYESEPRNPVRSADTLGNALPPVAEEQQPPGFWKVGSGHPGGIQPDLGGQLDFSSIQSPERAEATSAQPTPVDLPPPPALDAHPVGVHVVDTPEGKVIYYPYVPASVGPLVAAAQNAQEATSSGAPLALSNEGVTGGYLAAPQGQSSTPAVLRQPDGTWVAPGNRSHVHVYIHICTYLYVYIYV